MRDITPAAEKRVNAHEKTARKQFESSIIHNRVSRAVQEDDRLRHTLDVIERAYELDERDDLPKEMDTVAFSAAEDLNDHVDALVEMVVARECAAVIEDARTDWFQEGDVHGQFDVEDAYNEACEWLTGHHDAAEREGIDIDTIWGTSDEFDEEVTA